jgi:hypothetical protein
LRAKTLEQNQKDPLKIPFENTFSSLLIGVRTDERDEWSFPAVSWRGL